jgi:hypothetical protein
MIDHDYNKRLLALISNFRALKFTVKLKYNDHPSGTKIVTFVDRFSMFNGYVTNIKNKTQKMKVARGKWPLTQLP